MEDQTVQAFRAAAAVAAGNADRAELFLEAAAVARAHRGAMESRDGIRELEAREEGDRA